MTQLLVHCIYRSTALCCRYNVIKLYFDRGHQLYKLQLTCGLLHLIACHIYVQLVPTWVHQVHDLVLCNGAYGGQYRLNESENFDTYDYGCYGA